MAHQLLYNALEGAVLLPPGVRQNSRRQRPRKVLPRLDSECACRLWLCDRSRSHATVHYHIMCNFFATSHSSTGAASPTLAREDALLP